MVKTEDNPPTAQATYPQTWASAIPIDPALQQQAQTPGPYAHYQYAHYANAYPAQYQYATTATPQTAPATAQASTATASGSGTTAKNDSADVDALHDALGSAGVDLRAEAESLQRATDAPARAVHADRGRKQPPTPSFNEHYLGTTVRALSTHHKLARVPDESVTYLALALRARLAGLIEGMAAASQHRTDTTFDRPASFYPSAEGEEGVPMWGLKIRADVGKQLAALERVEKEEESRIRRERKERLDAQAAQAAQLAAAANASSSSAGGGGGMDEDEDGQPKKKKKKEGGPPKGITGEMHTKMANVTANQAAGLSTAKYAWMTAGGAGAKAKAAAAAAAAATTPSPSSPAPTTAAAATTSTATPAAAPATTAAAPRGWAKPYQSATKPLVGPGTAGAPGTMAPQGQQEDTRRAITLRDALFVIEKERGHGAGKGSARGWV